MEFKVFQLVMGIWVTRVRLDDRDDPLRLLALRATETAESAHWERLAVGLMVAPHEPVERLVVVLGGACRAVGDPSVELGFQGIDVPAREVLADKGDGLVAQMVEVGELR